MPSRTLSLHPQEVTEFGLDLLDILEDHFDGGIELVLHNLWHRNDDNLLHSAYRNIHDLVLNPVREEVPRDHWNAFHSLPPDLTGWHVHNLFNCVLLHTLHTLLFGSDLFLMDLIVHG